MFTLAKLFESKLLEGKNSQELYNYKIFMKGLDVFIVLASFDLNWY